MTIQNLTITHLKDCREIVSGLNLTLNPGDRFAVIGEEGNGKSTLLKLLYDETLVEDYAEWTGTIRKRGLRLAYLEQELPEADAHLTVREYMGKSGVMDVSSAQRMLSRWGFAAEKHVDQRLSTLSGGEKVKLRLALLAASEPDVYLLDEPSNDLDVETLELLEDFILAADCPVLYISHGVRLLENTANGVIHLEQIKRKTESRVTVVRNDYRSYAASRADAFRKQEQISRKEHEEFHEKKERWQKIYQRVDHEQESISRQNPSGGRLLKKKMHTVKAMEHRLEKEEAALTHRPEEEEAIFASFSEKSALPAGKRVLEFSLPRLTSGKKVLAENIRLDVTGPEKVCIVGRNGAGKTTLLRLLAKELTERRDIRAAYMPQDYGELLGGELDPVSFLATTGDKAEKTRLRTWLGSMKYTADEMAHPVNELSGGQRAKLLFLKMMEEGANVLILDEPTRNFSPLSAPVIRELLKDFPGAIIAVSHDRAFIDEVADRVMILDEKGLHDRRFQ
ncbi:MAG: ATP-binding cassette domain-containing protein [Clostridia bacterium]|nr:ATP-binding cassette domain-containing protein [Clostridia bacterium]